MSPNPESRLFFILDSRRLNSATVGIKSVPIRYRIRCWLLVAQNAEEADEITSGFYIYETYFMRSPSPYYGPEQEQISRSHYERLIKLSDIQEISIWVSRCYNIPVIPDDKDGKLYRHPDDVEEFLNSAEGDISLTIPNGVSTYEISKEFGFDEGEIEAGIIRTVELKLAQ